MSSAYLRYCWSIGGVTQQKFFTKKDEDGKIHCDDGPAVLNNVAIEYWQHGKKHRIDGPAVCTAKGGEYWYINDNDVTLSIHRWAKENNVNLDNMSIEEFNMFKLVWAFQ